MEFDLREPKGRGEDGISRGDVVAAVVILELPLAPELGACSGLSPLPGDTLPRWPRWSSCRGACCAVNPALSLEGIAGVWGVCGVCGEIGFPGEEEDENSVEGIIPGTLDKCLLDVEGEAGGG